jgi:hypothetical protein
MALKIWLIRKIEAVELELKYLKALLIMLEHVEKATDYPESDDDYSIRTDDIELLSETDDEENEKIKQKVLKKVKEIENKNVKN